jgi:hypothetical protein
MARQVLWDDPDLWPFEGSKMRFRLTYEGPLPSTQGAARDGQPDPRAPTKHAMRQRFHSQLRRLWSVTANLADPAPYRDILLSGGSLPPKPEALAAIHAQYGWNFVPLVTTALGVNCALDILLLRPTPRHPEGWFGDIDNRLKTLVDALQIPSANEQYVGHNPTVEERPFYCLLENDKLLTRVAVETDEMLEPVKTEGDVRLIITVEVRPLYVTVANLPFA